MGIIPSKKRNKMINGRALKTVQPSQAALPNGSWQNLGFELFKEKMSEETFFKKMKEADEPPPKAGLFSAPQLTLYAKKYQTKFALRTLVSQRHGNHPVSVGAAGSVTFLFNPLLPEHDFFVPGRVFPVRLHHSNRVRPDDAQLDIRVVSLKFSDTNFESPFDLMMHTGEAAAFWNIVSFDKLLIALAGGSEALEKFCFDNPWHFHLVVSAFRRAPDSFTDQRYYAWMVFDYKAEDGVPRYAKFRLIPADERPESGLMSESDQRKPWEYSRWANDHRTQSYLSDEFQERLLNQSIKYKLQIQLHEKRTDDSHLILHAARTWDEANHAWLDLAEITLTSLLSCDVLRDTRFSVQNIPLSIAIPEAKTIYDYSSLAILSSKAYAFLQERTSLQGACKTFQDQSIYCISVRTGTRKLAGTNATVTLTITGTAGRTKPLILDKWLHNDFESGQEDTYILDAEDVGDLLLIKLNNDQFGLNSDWFVDSVFITCSQNPTKLYEFPCFRWIQSEAVVFEGKAKLVTDDQHDVVKSQRQLEIKQRQEIYQWGDDPAFIDLPGFIKFESPKTLPKDVQFTEEAADDLHKATNKALINLGLIKLLNIFDSWNDFDDYRKAFVSFVGDVPPAADRWQDDRFYGSQFMNGCNPHIIKRCTALPTNFPVTQEIVGNLLDEGDILETAAQDGRIYMVDYKLLKDLSHYGQNNEQLERRHTCAAMGLFYIRSTGDLVPIAIQFHQVPCETNPIWTPNDSELDWIFAKMWLRNADTQWHQTLTHLLRTHLFMEPIALATWRQLPSLHPLWKLLAPHIRGVLAINTLRRVRLIPSGDVADNNLSLGVEGQVTLMQKYYKGMSWTSYDLPSVLKERGVLDAEKLPNFYYRDDSLLLWQAISEYVSSVLNVYYHSDDCVVKDTELQSWISDLHENGYPVRDGDADHGFPSSVTTKEQLTHLLTIVIFTCACQHAAVNFSQMDVFGFPPNTPALMRQPPPTKKGAVTVKDIMACLPTKHQAGVTIATMYNLTRIFPDERFLGDYSEGLFTDVFTREAILKFQEKLSTISATIRQRNSNLEIPYIYMLPEKTPNSITI